MDTSLVNARVFRFGIFELDAASGELRKRGIKVRLSDQPLQILRILLSRPGELVTRQDLRQELWGKDTFVDFDVALNSAIRKLRDALDESADNPRFIETLPRRGYRFIGSVQPVGSRDVSRPPTLDQKSRARLPHLRLWTVAILVLAIGGIGTLFGYQRWRHPTTGLPQASRSSRTSVPPGIKPEAYEAYLKGVSAAGEQSLAAFQNAIQYFEIAVARQPDYAVAHAALAQAHLQFLFGGSRSPREVIHKAESEVRTALRFDDTVASAHRILGMILQLFYWKWDEGEQEFARARALGNSDDLRAGIDSLLRTGHIEKAIADAEQARILDPLSFNVQMTLGAAYRAGGNYERALAAFRRGIEISPKQARGPFQLGITLVAMGRPHDAIEQLQAAVESSTGRNPRMQAYLGYAYAAAGRLDDARKIVIELDERRRREYISWYGTALIYDALRDKKGALAALERAYEDHAVEFGQFPQYPAFKTIAREPRYEAIMMKIRPAQ